MNRRRRWLARLAGNRAIRSPTGALRELFGQLGTLDTQVKRAEWVARLADWVCIDDRAGARSARLRELVAALESDPTARGAFEACLSELLLHASALRLFTDTGLSSEFGVIGEFVERVIRRVLPAPPQPANLAEVLEGMVGSPDDARWIAELSTGEFATIARLFSSGVDERAWAHVRADMRDAVTVLASQIATIGVSSDIVDRLPLDAALDVPFVAVVRDAERFVTVVQHAGGEGVPPREAAEIREAAMRVVAATARCRRAVGQVVAHLETQGVSLHLVFRLEQLVALFDRLDSLVRLLEPADAHTLRARAAFVGSLVQGIYRDRSLTAVVRGTVRQLSRKVVERTGDAGRHYVVHSSAGWWRVLRGAAGGGALTVGTTVLKFVTGTLSLAPFFTGLALSLNYAGSFVLMQLAGFKLATKQPAMFAATLADSLLEARSRADPAPFIDEVASVTRSQSAAVIGNLGAAIPVAVLFDQVWRWVVGRSFFDAESAAYAVHALDPLASGTVLFATVTGVILMISSLAGGWLENFAVFRRLPAAIAQHRVLIALIGPARAHAWSATFMHGIGGIGTSITLGVLLGMLPQIGAFFGIPLDVRHVTLSAAQLALGVSALGVDALATAGTWLAVLGVAIIGALNFGVSFALALFLAIRAREVSVPDALRLLRATVRELNRRPLAFVLPGASPAVAESRAQRPSVMLEHMATWSRERQHTSESGEPEGPADDSERKRDAR